jgi:formylglycine-generating enzyme required for sulfatase activity
MGATKDKKYPDIFEDETPLHLVNLPSFFISKFPITNKQYRDFVIDTNYRAPSGWMGTSVPDEKLNHPVVNISWFDAVAYCRWLTENTGKFYRLPSEAEWEKAAKGKGFKIFPWGNIWKIDCCNTKESGISDTTPVGQYELGRSNYDVYDLCGNVSEWTMSLWNNPETNVNYKYPYNADDGREVLDGDWDIPQLLKEEFTFRVLRGASFMFPQSFARCSFRRKFAQKNYGVDVGFRVAIS